MIDRATAFIHRHARPLDLALFQYFNGQATQDDVLDILSYYQNDDGGFGHAIEPDNWNPNSTAMGTWQATQYLRRIDCYRADHHVVNHLIKYLLNTRADNGLWPFTMPGNNNYPHAIWWQDKGEAERYAGYNPTASLLGYLYRTGHSELKVDITAAIRALQTNNEANMHEIICWLDLYCDLQKTGWLDIADIKHLLVDQLQQLLDGDSAKWQDYVLRPSTVFADRRFKDFAASFTDLIASEKQYILDTQQSDGSWPLPWQWHTDYPEWHVAKRWWQAKMAANYIQFCNQH